MFWYVFEFVFAWLCLSVWAVEVLLLRRQGPGGVSLSVASPPLPPHLTNYCATSTPLMKAWHLSISLSASLARFFLLIQMAS